MSTLSIPVPSETLKAIESLVKQGAVSSKADAVRQALQKYLEDKAVEAVLRASKEPSLKGDLDQLAKKL
ncbi:ribbon-helix-helix protein, CopG family [Candidatus Peregrinibacteria bacterium]|nr:ribbon-helix-helix protein, CopG family [Candidatus Peregrinibacteria bacterium]